MYLDDIICVVEFLDWYVVIGGVMWDVSVCVGFEVLMVYFLDIVLIYDVV